MLKKLQHPYLHLAIGIVSLLLLYFSPQLFLEEAPDYQKFAKNLHQKEQLATQKLLEYSQAPKVVFSKKEVQLAEDKGLSFFIAANNQLLFWTNRSIQLPTDLAVFEGEKGIIKLQDGWYEYLIRKNKEKTFLALILIKHHYPIVNKYLKNTFHHSFNINNQLEIVAQKEKGVTTISSSTGDFLLGLKDTNQENDFTQNNNWLLLFLFFNGYLFIISFLSKLLRKTTALRKYSAIIVILFIGCRGKLCPTFCGS